MHGLVGQRHAVGDARIAGRGRCQVGGRVEQGLQLARRQRAIARHQRQHGGQVAACAVAGHAQAGRIDLQGASLLMQPAPGAGAVVNGGRKAVLWGQAIVHRHHTDLGLVGQLPTQPIVAVQVANDPAPSVQVKRAGQRFSRWGACPPVNAQCQGAGVRVYGDIAHGRDLLGRRLQDVPRGCIGLASLLRGQRLKSGPGRLADHVEQAGKIGVESGHGRRGQEKMA